MKMGIERALKAAFGDALKEVVQVRVGWACAEVLDGLAASSGLIIRV